MDNKEITITSDSEYRKLLSDMKGFSETNIKYIRRWYLFYMNGLQPIAQFYERVISLVKQIPWGHNQRIINKC